MTWIWPALIFAVGWTVSLTYISVFYHRGLTHTSFQMQPWLRQFVMTSGVWMTGIDPLGWAAMHRLHHEESDTVRDPHSPVNVGVRGVALAQLRSYERALIGIGRRDAAVLQRVDDLGTRISWPNRQRIWWLPYLLHAVFGAGLALLLGDPYVAPAYLLGMMGHPIQGWAVNAIGHSYGYRRFETPDRSRNNLLVALLVMGEGLQNNHHAHPRSARFASCWWEPDAGYLIVLALEAIGLIRRSSPVSKRHI